MKNTFLLLAVFSFLASQTFAQPGTLDPTFGTGGKVLQSLGQKDDWAWVSLLQPDGKILAGGYSTVGFVQRQAVARFNPDGSPDQSFGAGGFYVSPTERAVFDMALLPDGKVLTCGFQYNSNFYGGFAVSQFTAGGFPDAGFGAGGSVRHAFGKVTEEARAIAVQPDGKIVVGGFIESGTNNYDFALIRLKTDGSLDDSFGDAGKVVTAVSSGHDRIFDLIIQPDGKILACGNAWDANKQDHIALVRYQTDGSLDAAFGANGVYNGQKGEGLKLMLLPDGQILLAGREVGTTVPDAYIWKFNPNGVLDNSFGVNGLAFVVDISLNGATLDAGNQILICGLKSSDFATARFLPNGALDSSFGASGVVKTNVAPFQNLDQPHSINVQADGKIVVVGEAYDNVKHNMALVRYNTGDAPPPDSLVSLHFDGDDFVSLPASVGQALGGSNFTLEAWIKGYENELPAHGVILSNRIALNTGLYFGIHDEWGGSDYNMLTIRYNGINYLHINNGSFNAEILDGTCHHVAVSRNGGTLSFYIDGLLIGSHPVVSGSNLSTTAPMLIGNDAYSKDGFVGSISDVRVWSVARTAAQIQNNLLGVAPNSAGLVGNWILNEGAGQAVNDKKQLNPGILGSDASVESEDPFWEDGNCSPIVGTENNFNSLDVNDLYIFPNPVSGGSDLKIRLGERFSGEIKIEFLRLDGRVLRAFFREKNGLDIVEILEIPEMAAGAFILRVSDARGSAARLVLKR